jgi:hypothetical protein
MGARSARAAAREAVLEASIVVETGVIEEGNLLWWD